MNHVHCNRVLGFVAAVAMSALALPLPARADLAKWDQARATEIAKQLAKSSEAWQLAVREQPDNQVVGGGSAQEGFGLHQKAQTLQEMTAGFAAQLAAGKGHDETLDQYKSIKEIVDDTETIAQRAELDEPTMDAWAKVADGMRQIAPYYDPKADSGAAK